MELLEIFLILRFFNLNRAYFCFFSLVDLMKKKFKFYWHLKNKGEIFSDQLLDHEIMFVQRFFTVKLSNLQTQL